MTGRPQGAPWTVQTVLRTLDVPLIEIGLVSIGCLLAYVLLARLARVVPGMDAARSKRAVSRVRRAALGAWAALSIVVLAYNGWLVWQGVAPREHALLVARSVGPGLLRALSIAVARIVAAALGVAVALRVARYLLRLGEAAINRWDGVRDNDQSLERFFAGLSRALTWTSWLLWLVLAGYLLGFPEVVLRWMWMAVRVYVIVAAGLSLVRSAGVIVDTLDGLSHGMAARRDWLRYYERLRPLIPTFRAALEYVIWIGIAALLLAQIDGLRGLSAWGPRLIEAIGIFLAGRVVIELGHLEIGHRVLPRAGLSEAERRRRGTMVPLLRSVFTYATYFGVAVLILASVGFNPMPFLAGAGILGLVIGFGAQSLINDVVSGFFILFENVYLVGDTIETGAARGVVEAIEFRTTKVRDDDGRLHIIRNADVGRVVNYSSEYGLAVVTFEVAYDADMATVFGTLRDAGEAVRREYPVDALDTLEIGGITRFGEKSLTIRATMRVRAGRHDAIAAALRLAIKEGFDRAAGGAPRKGLLPLTTGSIPGAAATGFTTPEGSAAP